MAFASAPSRQDGRAPLAAGRPAPYLAEVEEGLPSPGPVRAGLRAALEASFERFGPAWLCAVAALALGMLYITVWADIKCEAHRDDACDQPLAPMLRLLSLILVVVAFQQVIIRNLLCYSLSRDGPVPPCRVVVFRRASFMAAALWPVAGCWMLSRARECSGELTAAVRVLTGYCLAVALVTLVLPAALVAVMALLLRHRLVRPPRGRHAAPEDLIERLPALRYDPALFDGSGRPGRYPAECAVCLDAFAPGRRITRTPCRSGGHAFHTGCLRGWLRCSRTCPLCRADLLELAEAEEALGAGSSASSGESEAASGSTSGEGEGEEGEEEEEEEEQEEEEPPGC